MVRSLDAELLHSGAERGLIQSKAIGRVAATFDPSVTSQLIDAGADLAATDHRGRNAARIARDGGHDTIVQLLKTAGAPEASPERVHDSDDMVVHCRLADSVSLRAALQRGVSPDWSDHKGRTALLFSADPSTQRALLSAGATVDARADSESTALLRMSRFSHTAVKTLLAAGADPRTTYQGGKTALHLSSERGLSAIAKTLLDAGVDIDAPTDEGKTPMMFAAFDDRVGVVRLLLAHGANTEAQDALGRTVLMTAAGAGRAEITELLLKAGTPVDAADSNGVTALMRAVDNGQVDAARRLLHAGANPKRADRYGSTSIDRAMLAKDEKLVSILREPQKR